MRRASSRAKAEVKAKEKERAKEKEEAADAEDGEDAVAVDTSKVARTLKEKKNGMRTMTMITIITTKAKKTTIMKTDGTMLALEPYYVKAKTTKRTAT